MTLVAVGQSSPANNELASFRNCCWNLVKKTSSESNGSIDFVLDFSHFVVPLIDGHGCVLMHFLNVIWNQSVR